MFLAGAAFSVLIISLLFIIRLYVVVKTGPKYKPGTKGPVAVLVVAGSGNIVLHVPRNKLFSALKLKRSYFHETT